MNFASREGYSFSETKNTNLAPYKNSSIVEQSVMQSKMTAGNFLFVYLVDADGTLIQPSKVKTPDLVIQDEAVKKKFIHRAHEYSLPIYIITVRRLVGFSRTLAERFPEILLIHYSLWLLPLLVQR